MGNGAKAQQKRERNAAKTTTAKSQLKSNQASMSIVCQTCKQAFMTTTRAPALEEHAASKHNATMATCFPNFGK